MPGFVLALLASALDLAADAFGWPAVRPFTKPLPALILAAVAYLAGTAGSRRLAFGLAAAAVGDELLLAPAGLHFLLGMLCFAVMHVAYITAFLRRAPRAHVPRIPVLAYGVILIVATIELAPHTGALRIPVMIYSLLLVLMAARALPMPRITAYGAAIFVISDMTLAFATFVPSFPLAPRASDLFVLGTYYAAQLLITWGMTNAAIQDAAHDQTLAEEGARHV